MAICGNCGAERSRVRTVFSEDGGKQDECPNCHPESFEKFTMPSDQKIWMGYEAHPNEYMKAEDGGFDRKPEYRAEQEAKLQQETAEEMETRLRAEENKRRNRRTLPMTEAEEAAAIRKAAMYAEMMQKGIDIVH